MALRLRRARRARRARSCSARPTARRWACAAPATITVRAVAQSVRRQPEFRGLVGRQRGGGRRRSRALRGGHGRRRLHSHSVGLVQRGYGLQGLLRPRALRHAAQRFRGANALSVRGADNAQRGATQRWSCRRLQAPTRATLQPRNPRGFPGGDQRSIKGWKIAYSPDLDVFLGGCPKSASSSPRPCSAFADAGATVEEVQVVR